MMIDHYRQRELKYTSTTTTLEKWSTNSNDKTLIAQGYKATGQKRKK